MIFLGNGIDNFFMTRRSNTKCTLARRIFSDELEQCENKSSVAIYQHKHHKSMVSANASSAWSEPSLQHKHKHSSVAIHQHKHDKSMVSANASSAWSEPLLQHKHKQSSVALCQHKQNNNASVVFSA